MTHNAVTGRELGAILLAMGCRLQQGRFFGPPLAADDFARLVDHGDPDEAARRQRSGSSDVS